MTLLKRLLIGVLRAYQYLVSPFMPPSCRFYPSCSHYAVEAVERHGAIKGSWLTAWRLLRCNPWGGCGYDPVPDKREASRTIETSAWPTARSRSVPKHGHS